MKFRSAISNGGGAETLASRVSGALKVNFRVVAAVALASFSFFAAPARTQAQEIVLTEPAEEIAHGEYDSFQVALSETPSEVVVVTFSSEDSNLQFEMDPPTVHLSDTAPVDVRVRSVEWVNRTVEVTARAASADTGFNGKEAVLNIAFDTGSSELPTYYVYPLGNVLFATNDFHRGRGNIVTVFVEPSTTKRISIGINDQSPPTDDITVDVGLLPGGDPQILFLDEEVEFTRSLFDEWTHIDVVIDPGETSPGTATLVMTLRTDDEEYTAFAEFVGAETTVVLSILSATAAPGSVLTVPGDRLTFTEGDSATVSVYFNLPSSTDATVNIIPANPALVVSNPSDRSLEVSSSDTEDSNFRVVVTYADNDVAGGGLDTMLTFEVNSDDPRYPAMSRAVLAVEVVDDDVAGINVEAPDPLVVAVGGQAVVAANLSAEPADDVVLRAELVPTSAVPAGIVLETVPASPAMLTYTSSDWFDTQDVAVRARQADPSSPVYFDSDIGFRVDFTASGDSAFAGISESVEGTVPALLPPGQMRLTPPGPRAEVELGGDLEFSLELSSAPSADVVVAVALDVTGVPDGIDVVLVPASPSFTYTSSNFGDAQTFSVRAMLSDPNTEVEIEEDVEFLVRVSATSADADYGGDVIEVTGVIPASGSSAGEEVLVGQVVGSAAVGSAQFALDVVGGQLGGGLPEAGIAFSSPGAAAELAQAWTDRESGWRGDFSSLVDSGAKFALPLNGDGVLGGRAVLWGQLGLFDISGESEFEGVTSAYDGRAFAGMYGVMVRRPDGTDLGVAFSHTDSSADLADAGSLKEVDMQVLGIHPYAGKSFDGGRRAWVVGSLGDGDVEVKLDDGSAIETGTTVKALGVGVEGRWVQGKAIVSGRLEGLAGNSELDPSAEFTDAGIVNDDGTPVKTDILRLRAEVEAMRPYALQSGDLVYPYLLVGLRHDGGDLDGEQAVEVGGGVRARVSDAVSVDVKVRLQAAGGDHEEHSVTGRVSYDAGADGRGLVASFTPERASVGHRWGTSLLGQSGTFGPTLRYAGSGEGLTGRFGFRSDSLRAHVEGGSDETEFLVEYRIQ